MKNIYDTTKLNSGETSVFHLALDCAVSTNNVAKELVGKYSSPLLVTAREQSGGRGRQGKSFSSPAGGLYMSLLFPTGVPVSSLGGETQCAAVAVCRAIRKLHGLECGVKWVNDIYCEGRKLCGILAESVNSLRDGELYSDAVVIGIGVNVLHSPDVSHIPSSVRPCALCEFVTVGEDGIMELCREITAQLVSMYAVGFSYSLVREEYESLSVLTGHEIEYESGGTKYHGLCTGLGENGELEVVSEGEKHLLCGGEVNIRITKRES